MFAMYFWGKLFEFHSVAFDIYPNNILFKKHDEIDNEIETKLY